jgi:hypothetical protein
MRALSALSHHTGSAPNRPRNELRIPSSGFIIHCQVVPETMMGRSHGTRNMPRSGAASRNPPRWKKTASVSPSRYWKASETAVNTAVCHTIVQNCGCANTDR